MPAVARILVLITDNLPDWPRGLIFVRCLGVLRQVPVLGGLALVVSGSFVGRPSTRGSASG